MLGNRKGNGKRTGKRGGCNSSPANSVCTAIKKRPENRRTTIGTERGSRKQAGSHGATIRRGTRQQPCMKQKAAREQPDNNRMTCKRVAATSRHAPGRHSDGRCVCVSFRVCLSLLLVGWCFCSFLLVFLCLLVVVILGVLSVWCSFDRELLVVCWVVVHFFYVVLYLVLSLAIPF